MRFLIDGHVSRVQVRKEQWPEAVIGQLLTPLTGYKLGKFIFAVDNGAYSNFDCKRFARLLSRYSSFRKKCLFVAIPDKVGNHKATYSMYQEYNALANGWKKAFVAQDGFTECPSSADALFIGGTNAFKDSLECLEIISYYKRRSSSFHIHVGRVNTIERFRRFYEIGADTCDGSGISRYDHMLPAIRDSFYIRKSLKVRY